MAIYLYEFLYRGRAEGSAEAPAWHVVLASDDVDAFGEVRRSERTLTMAQAIEAGFDLPEVIAGINATLLSENERLRAQVASLSTEAREDVN